MAIRLPSRPNCADVTTGKYPVHSDSNLLRFTRGVTLPAVYWAGDLRGLPDVDFDDLICPEGPSIADQGWTGVPLNRAPPQRGPGRRKLAVLRGR
jgi:hypothetical protein